MISGPQLKPFFFRMWPLQVVRGLEAGLDDEKWLPFQVPWVPQVLAGSEEGSYWFGIMLVQPIGKDQTGSWVVVADVLAVEPQYVRAIPRGQKHSLVPV